MTSETRPTVWTLNPSSEREIALERHRWSERRRAFRDLAVAVFGACPLIVAGILGDRLPPATIALPLLGIPFLGLRAIVRSARAKEIGERKRDPAKDEAKAVGGFAVELTVLQGAAPTGYDHGVVWTEEGRLFFVGARTSFGLYGSAAAPEAKTDLAASHEDAPLSLPLRASTVAGTVSIRFRPLPMDAGGNAPQSAASLGWLVRAWLDQATEGESQLPPLTLGPDAPSPGSLFREAAETTLLWGIVLPLTLIAPFVLLMSWMCWAIPFIPLLFLALRALYRGFGDPIDAWQAWRDRQRLDREVA